VTKVARYRLLAVLYGSQFIPLAFFLYGLTAVLRKRGVSLEQIALIQLLGLAWVAKFAWAPLVDRYGWGRLGHYRGWQRLCRPRQHLWFRDRGRPAGRVRRPLRAAVSRRPGAGRRR
jgi:hypothetical protein